MKLSILVTNIFAAIKFIYFHGFSGFKIFTHLTWQERIILYRLADQFMQPSCIVEIGSYLGASAYFLASGILKTKVHSKLYCVDTWLNDGMFEGKRDTWQEFNANVSNFKEIIIACRGKSEDISKTFSEPIDMLFIDGDHSYQGCKSDADNWLPFLRSDGIVIFHDYGWAEGVKKVVNDSIASNILKNGIAYKNIFWAYKN